MKKKLILGMSFLLIASALQLHSMPDYNFAIEDKYPRLNQAFRDIKRKYPHAGFKDSILAEREDASHKENNCSLGAQPIFDHQTKKVLLKVISTAPAEFQKAEAILEKIATNPSEVTSAETLYIAKYEGCLLHEIYHCNVTYDRKLSRLTAPNAKERIAILTPILLGNAIAHMKSQFLKTRGLLPLTLLLSTSAALTVADKAITKTKAALDRYQEEIDADMHVAQHADGLALSNMIIGFKWEEVGCTPGITFDLLAQRESAHPILKPIYTGLINTTRTINHFYNDQEHPTHSKRVQYLLKALQEKHPEYVNHVTTMLKIIDTEVIKLSIAEYEKMLKKPSKHEELSYIQGFV